MKNIEAERSILGAILLDPKLLENVKDILEAFDFQEKSHELIYQHMLDLSRAGKSIDYVTLAESLQVAGDLENAGGRSGISHLIDGVPRLSTLGFYARIVLEKSFLRHQTPIEVN